MSARTRIFVAGVTALAAMVALFGLRPMILDRLELTLLDWRFDVRGAAPASDEVVIVAIDEKSIDELGRFPWPRRLLADIVDRLSDAGARAIGFDIVFSEPEVSLRSALESLPGVVPEMLEPLTDLLRVADGDRLLAEAIRRSQRSVLGFYFATEQTDEIGDLSQGLRAVRKARVLRQPADPERWPGRFLECSGIEPIVDHLRSPARLLGYINTTRDPDGGVRRAPLILRCGGVFHYSLDMALLQLATGQPIMVLENDEGLPSVRLGGRTLPTDESGFLQINFRGPPGSFASYSASDVLVGDFPDAAFREKVVLIGITEVAIAEFDQQVTPFGNTFPGVEVHASVLDNLLLDRALVRDATVIWLEVALIVSLGLLVTFSVPRLRTVARSALLTGLLALAVVGGGVLAFSEYGLWLNLTYPLLTLVVVYTAVAGTREFTVENAARDIRRKFDTYVPPAVVEQMVGDPHSFKLGGERRDISILFSDVRGFTGLAEEIGPEATMRLMNAYLTPMTELIRGSGGTLDKYIGDAIVALWGAPLDVEGHPALVAETALKMQQEVEHLRQRPDLVGADRLRVGIGIHSGDAVVGNMGSKLRFDYSMTGDSVNLCARLEGLTKFYGTEIVASADLVGRISGFALRELDQVRVKGRKESVKLFEILRPDARDTVGASWIDAWTEGLTAYRAASWDAARRAFREVLELRGDDAPARLMLERISGLSAQTPDDWDGTWNFQEK